MLWSYRKCPISSLKETGPSCAHTFDCSDDSGQNIWKNLKNLVKMDKTGKV